MEEEIRYKKAKAFLRNQRKGLLMREQTILQELKQPSNSDRLAFLCFTLESKNVESIENLKKNLHLNKDLIILETPQKRSLGDYRTEGVFQPICRNLFNSDIFLEYLGYVYHYSKKHDIQLISSGYYTRTIEETHLIPKELAPLSTKLLSDSEGLVSVSFTIKADDEIDYEEFKKHLIEEKGCVFRENTMRNNLILSGSFPTISSKELTESDYFKLIGYLHYYSVHYFSELMNVS